MIDSVTYGLHANNDDPIVKIVPKHLFAAENHGRIEVGKEYGSFY